MTGGQAAGSTERRGARAPRQRRRFRLSLALVAAWTGTALAADPTAGEAPFGLAWGALDRVDTPSMVDREANLTGLYYFHDRPLASGPDTVEVVLVVCREQGLQQVVWVGRLLDGPAYATAREAIRREGVRRYGEPRPGPEPGSLVWPSGRAILATRTLPDGNPRIGDVRVRSGLRRLLGQPPHRHGPPRRRPHVGPDRRGNPVIAPIHHGLVRPSSQRRAPRHRIPGR